MYLAEILAISAAVCIALGGMLIGELRGQVDVFRLGRWQMVTAALLTGAVAFVTGGWQTVAPWQIAYLLASSFFGIIFASSFYFAAIFLSGPRNTALMFSMTCPSRCSSVSQRLAKRSLFSNPPVSLLFWPAFFWRLCSAKRVEAAAHRKGTRADPR